MNLLPEMILAAAICAVILADMFAPLRLSRLVCGAAATVGGAAALLALAGSYGPAMAQSDATLFEGMFVRDGLAVFFKLVFLLGTEAIFLFSLRSREVAGYRQGEFYGLLLGATLGACFVASAGNVIMLVLGIETLSMCSYVLAGFIKHERVSAEAGLKYMLYGAVASGVMLFGFSYLYGLTGTLDLAGMARFLEMRIAGAGAGQAAYQFLPLVLSLLLVLAGLGFKIAMVPFQFWAPDVYQGSPTPVTAYLSVVSKAAGFSALLRLFLPFFGDGAGQLVSSAAQLPVIFGVLAVVTMTFGNLVALRQTDVKRLLAYSSIAHAGYLLMALTVFSPDSVEAMLFYLFVYFLMNLGAFWVVIVLVNRLGGAEIERFRGVGYKAPFLTAAMFVFLISLTGLPPTAGFVGKLILFKVVVGAGVDAMRGGALTPEAWAYFVLALIGVINSVVSLYYYMKIIKAMVFEQPEAGAAPLAEDGMDRLYAALFAVPVLAFIWFAPILALVNIYR
ncbi:MAG: NADH-quinone oxidoreductase subunit N [bacterium]|nr:NADH-quinone oxidoreductase subunit N [bacterium]